MRLWIRVISVLLLLLLVVCGAAGGEPTLSPGRSLHADDGNFSNPDHMGPPSFQRQQQQVLEPLPGLTFDLRVQVSDALTRQSLSRAVVEVYVNYTRTESALSGEDGGVWLRLPYPSALPVTVVARKDGYISTLLPCKTSRTPIFSSVTMSLLGLNQGNIWLFEDSVLITGKTSDALSQPAVQFPKSLLNLTDNNNVTEVRAYLTVPKLMSDGDTFLSTVGIVSSKSGFVSVELRPVAAVSVQLFSGDAELHVNGPIQMSLSVPDSCGLHSSNVVPAWFFNQTTGGWMRKGLGKVVSADGKLLWTFTAPHLGYWIAAPLAPTRGFFGFAIPSDFIPQHSSFLMLLLGGALVCVVCFLVGLWYCRRSPLRESKALLPVARKDQTTSTCEDQVFEIYSRGAPHPRDPRHLSSVNPQHSGDVVVNPNAVSVTLECSELGADHVTRLCKAGEQSLFFYNQPLAILHAPAFFHVDEQENEEEEEEQAQWIRAATLPRASNGSEPPGKVSPLTPNREAEPVEQLGVFTQGATSSTDTSRTHFGLPESASVPGTLNKLRESRRSLQPPRAWFVSLEGKPAAEIRYAVSAEQQRRRRPADSRETSLDSGVDMGEVNQAPGKRTVTLERKATFLKNTSSGKRRDPP